jgi:SAM-dependent methyltransferase
MSKSATDKHWNERAIHEADPSKVNIADTYQRELETAFVLTNVPRKGRVLEVGCGNGFLTDVLRRACEFVDAFDFSENMVQQASALHGESNNRFFHDSVLTGSNVAPPYDGVVCVRVLINLRDASEQKIAIRNMASWLGPKGQLILVEGFQDGFDALNQTRRATGIPEMKPAAINFYSGLSDILPIIEKEFTIVRRFHTGMFDFLTRVVYPSLVGAENAQGPSDFHGKVLPIVRAMNPDEFAPMARVHGFHLQRR